jgi:acetyltransferase-like isoleucine patch superfamily enzyme
MSKKSKDKSGPTDKKDYIHPTVTLYRDAEVKESIINENSVIGDFSRIQKSNIGQYVKIDRNNLIQNSVLGKMTYTGSFTVIQSTQIGSFCSISWGVTIGGGEHDYKKLTTHDFLYNHRYGFDGFNEYGYDRYSQPCNIGNDVWIGANSTILRGLNIDSGAVIGANSVVTHDVPSYAIVVGNPAKIIKYRFQAKTIKRLLRLKWWDFDFDVLKENIPVITSHNIDSVIDHLETL